MPKTKPVKVPKLRHHKASGQSGVVLDGKFLYLGKHGSSEARERYDRVVAEWLSCKRQSLDSPQAQLDYAKAVTAQQQAAAQIAEAKAATTVEEVIAGYWAFAETYYRKAGEPTEELNHIRRAARVLRRLYGTWPAAEFSPLKLKAVRDAFVRGDLEHDPKCTRDPRPQSRPHVNANVQRIKRIFKWAVENELVPGSVYHALLAVGGLRKGRSEAREGRIVRPVPLPYVEAVYDYVVLEVKAMIQLQLLSGMRSGEVCQMRTCDVDTTGELWCYRPQRHKTEHHDVAREIWLGPKAQAVLRPWLRRTWPRQCSPHCGRASAPGRRCAGDGRLKFSRARLIARGTPALGSASGNTSIRSIRIAAQSARRSVGSTTRERNVDDRPSQLGTRIN